MTLTVNGKPHELPDGCSVETLIERLGLSKAVCAAEVNKAIVPRSDRASHALQQDDHVEIVTLVGGG